jgi:hypothetical protein
MKSITFSSLGAAVVALAWAGNTSFTKNDAASIAVQKGSQFLESTQGQD